MREKTLESPPPPSTGMTMRQWFAGLALANPELMKDVSENERVSEAVRLADELIRALEPPRAPALDSMRSPTCSEMHAWEEKIKIDNAKKVIHSESATEPAVPIAKNKPSPEAAYASRSSLPPLPPLPPPSKLPMCRLSYVEKLPANTRYSFIKNVDERKESIDSCDNELNV